MVQAQTILTFRLGEGRPLLAVDHRAALNPRREGVSRTAIGAQNGLPNAH